MKLFFIVYSILFTLNYKSPMAKRTYINESHRKYVEACQKEVDEMSKHPLSCEEFFRKARQHKEEAMKAMIERSASASGK